MHNTYISSTISLRSKGSQSFSSNDYCHFLNERSEKSSSSSSWVCSAFSIHRVPINPSFLYGLRQSTLIHCSASRRLILGGGDRYLRLPVSDLNPGSNGIPCSLKERSIISRRRRGEGRFGCMVCKEKRERCYSCVNESAEAMLSLLTEEIGENYVGGGKRNGRLVSGRLQVGKRGHFLNESCREEKENVGIDSLKRNSKCQYESVTNKLREEGYRRSDGREGSSRSENRGSRREGSSCSSYYSVSSSSDIESDEDIQVKHEGFVGEYGYKKKESRRYGEDASVGEVTEQIQRYGNDVGVYKEVSIQGNTALGSDTMDSGVEWDSINKGEKKFTEVSIGQTKSRESSQKHSKVSKIDKSDSEIASSSLNRFNGRKENSTLAVNLVDESREQHIQTGHRVIEQSESRRKSQQLSEMSEIHGYDFKTLSSSQKRVIAAVNSVEDTRHRRSQMDHRIIGQDESRRKPQQLPEMLEIHDSDIDRSLPTQRQSETRMKNREENSILVLRSVQEAKEQHTQKDDQVIRQNESRRKSQQLTGMSEIHDSEKTTSQRQSETRMKNQEENSTSFLSLVQEAQGRGTITDQKVLERTKSRIESQDLANLSVIHSSDTETVTASQRLFEKRMSGREGNLTSVVDLAEEARERHNQIGERVIEQIGSRKESPGLIKMLSLGESNSGRASSSQTLLKSVRQATEQQTGAWKEDERNSQVMVTPPPSQLVARCSLDVESTGGYATQEAYSETSETGSSTLYAHSHGKIPSSFHELDGGTRRNETNGEPSNLVFHEEALGSVNHSEKSSSASTRLAGEFIEKLRHEVSTSEIQDMTSSENTFVYKEEKYIQEGSSPYVPEDFQSKVHGSRQSSASSGTKGPSDEMWDVADQSFQEPPRTEASERTPTSGGSIVRRTGRSLWSIIADIVQLRWGTRSETHNSGVKSGGRNSSNESVGSEAWFSGHEPDEEDVENVKMGRRGIPKEPRSDDQPQLGISPIQHQGEASNAMSSPDKIRQIEADRTLSLGTLERSLASKDAFSASKDASSASGEEHFEWNGDGKGGQGLPSSIVTVDSPLPLPARRLKRSPVIEEITESSKVEVSRGGLMEQVKQPARERLTEASGTEGKGGELKQRKLQRNKQVLTERFDEWEEAYKLESEQRKIDEMFMREALLEAKKAANTWEVPVGAVLVQRGKIIARGYNLVEELRDSTAHAEMICIREASNLLQTWRLAETTLYVTLEPCPMCAGAILQARIDTMVWGAPNKLLGADGSWVRLFPSGSGGSSSDPTNQPAGAGPVHPFHPNMTIRRGVLATECADVMRQFFQLRRKKEKPEPPMAPISAHPSKFLSKMHDIFSIMFCL